jgi:hypothetical protein
VPLAAVLVSIMASARGGGGLAGTVTVIGYLVPASCAPGSL